MYWLTNPSGFQSLSKPKNSTLKVVMVSYPRLGMVCRIKPVAEEKSKFRPIRTPFSGVRAVRAEQPY